MFEAPEPNARLPVNVKLLQSGTFVTLTVLPAIVTVVVRAAPVYGSAEIVTVLAPVPPEPPPTETLAHAFPATLQLQEVGAFTWTVAELFESSVTDELLTVVKLGQVSAPP